MSPRSPAEGCAEPLGFSKHSEFKFRWTCESPTGLIKDSERMDSAPPPRFASASDLDCWISTPSEKVIEALRQCPGRIAVLGAAGKMGFHLSLMLQRAAKALGRTDPILTVSRFGSSASRSQFEQAGFELISSDLSDPDQVAALPPADNVFFLAGVKFGTSHAPGLLERMNVLMPRLVAQHYRDSRIVALSTGCVYAFATPESGGSTEESPTDPPGDYARSCLGRETAFGTSNSRTSLIRLNYAVELRYGVLVDLAQTILAGRPVNLTTGYVNVIWQGDALSHIVQTLPLASSPPFILNVTGAGVLRVRDIATSFGRRFGKDVSFTGTEAPTAWLNNASLSHRLFGPPQVSLDQMIDWIATWLEQDGETLGKPTHFENRDGSY